MILLYLSESYTVKALIGGGVLLGGVIGVIAAMKLGAWRRGKVKTVDRVVTQHITERVRSVGRLVALEVCAKEIATATSGIADGWLPPVLLEDK